MAEPASRQFPGRIHPISIQASACSAGRSLIATTLIVIDVTLAALFWSWGADDIIARLVRKTLLVGVFGLI